MKDALSPASGLCIGFHALKSRVESAVSLDLSDRFFELTLFLDKFDVGLGDWLMRDFDRCQTLMKTVLDCLVWLI